MKIIFTLSIMIAGVAALPAQEPSVDSNRYRPVLTMTAQQDRDLMLKQLGITKTRPGPSANPAEPNHANENEDLANPCPVLPDPLLTKNNKAVTNAETWFKVKRPEIVEAFENEVYGKIPVHVPSVSWSARITENEFVGRIPVLARHMIGKVNNSEYPLVKVDINMVLVLPRNVRGPVPVMMMFGFPSLPSPAQPSVADLETINDAFKKMMIKADPALKLLFEKYPAYNPITKAPGPNFFAPSPNGDSPPAEQLLAAGWGYCTIEPGSIQADNGAGLTRGIIGLVNKGQPRKPDDWGALRAWAWGASRALDFLETDSLVDAKKVAIEGVSRYGKAALVTMAFDQRFAAVLAGSSGKGGATLHRRIFGEAVESLAGSGEYHWMAGNYLKYAAEEGRYGRKTGCDLPVDAHELIALCAPRPAFISYGIPEKGDAKWLDQLGSYKATVAAGPVFRLLGARDLGVGNDYTKEQMPAVLSGLLDGTLAWRQHDGGHTDAPNFQFFIPWANRELKYIKQPR